MSDGYRPLQRLPELGDLLRFEKSACLPHGQLVLVRSVTHQMAQNNGDVLYDLCFLSDAKNTGRDDIWTRNDEWSLVSGIADGERQLADVDAVDDVGVIP